MSTVELNESDESGIAVTLVGRRVVKAERGDFPVAGAPNEIYRYSYHAEARLTLDNGTELYVVPNEGCGGCSSGWYELEHLATVDNVITSARVVEEEVDGDKPQRYAIFVFADAVEFKLVSVVGDDGNGYYGTGFALIVVDKSED